MVLTSRVFIFMVLIDIQADIIFQLKCYYDEKIIYPIFISSKSIFKTRRNGILGLSIPHLVPEVFRFLKYANEKRVTSFTHRDEIKFTK